MFVKVVPVDADIMGKRVYVIFIVALLAVFAIGCMGSARVVHKNGLLLEKEDKSQLLSEKVNGDVNPPETRPDLHDVKNEQVNEAEKLIRDILLLLETLCEGNNTEFATICQEFLAKEAERLQTPFSFDDIFDTNLRPRGYDGTWLSGISWDFKVETPSAYLPQVFDSSDTPPSNDLTYFYTIAENRYSYRAHDDRNVYEFDLDTLEDRLLMLGDILTTLSSGTYYVSSDSKYILIAINRTRVWRHSFTASYKIFNVSDANPETQLIDFPNGDFGDDVLQFARWSSSGHALTFVYGNNLYYQGSPHQDAQQVTDTGLDPYVFNGIPDWVYEEDVIGSSRGHHFSPDNQNIAYVEYDDTDVPLQSWPHYGSKEDVYGKIVQIGYPKAGDTKDGKLGQISKVRIYAVNVNDLATKVELEPPTEIYDEQGFFYYTRIAWQDDTHVYVFWTNRAQNYSVSALYDLGASTRQNNLQQTVTGGWIDAPAPEPWFIDGGSQYLTLLPREVGQTGAWPHVALVTAPSDSEGTVTFLTDGEDHVTAIVGFDAINNTVYYISTAGDPTERHIHRVGLNIGERTPVCMTCEFPNSCRYISGSFSFTGQYYIERCGGPGIPEYRLKSSNGLLDINLENNSDVQARLDEKELPGRFFTDVDLGNGYTGKAEYFIPYGYTGAESYPLLVYVYGGPNSQRVTKSYSMSSNTNNWLTYMKSTHKVVVASVDGRGSFAYGDRYRFQMYRNLAPIGIEDQLTGARWFREQDYVKSDEKSAIFGWSYGGFISSQLLAESSAAEYECGIAVAPVTTKRYYDSAYTERYLAFDLPEDNQAGYNDTDVLQKAAKFRDKKYCLAHGTHDDNVHFMHMTQMVKALVEEEVQFRQLMYVDENHSIASTNQAKHLYRALTDFLLNDCWTTQ